MSIPDGSTLRVSLHFSSPNASDIVNVYHLFTDSVGDVSETNLLSDLQGWASNMMTNLSGIYDQAVTLDEIEVWVWNSALSRWDSVGSTTSTWAGTSTTSEALPSAVAPLVTADTVDAHAKGRKYLPPPVEVQVTDGILENTAVNALLNFLTDYASTYVGTYTELIPGIWQIASQAFKLFTGTGTATNVLAYQRRRKDGVGE